MNGVGIFFLVLFFLIAIGIGGWFGWVYWQAHRQGLPPPPLSAYIPFYSSGSRSNYPVAPRPGGITGWVQDKYQSLRNRGGSSSAARDASPTGYESSRRGFNQMDNDHEHGAWDDRVGQAGDSYGRIGDYEEQELGLHPNNDGPYGGGGYGDRHGRLNASSYEDEPRGRSRSREDLGSHPPGEGQGQFLSARADPFADDAEHSSLRDVSPRPSESDHNKKSAFREGL